MTNFANAIRPLVADFLSTIAFVIFYAVTASIRDAILFGIAIGVLQILWLLVRGKPIAAMQWMSLGLVVVLGGASLLTADPRFVMIKPSIGTFAIGLVMLKRGWMIRYMPKIVTDNVPDSVPIFWGYVWAGALFLMSAGNLAVALLAGPKEWAWYNAVVPLSIQAVLFALQYASIRRRVRRQLRTAPAA